MGLRLIMNRFSQILSPAMFGALGQTVGLSAAFYAGGSFLILLMLGFAAFSSLKWQLRTQGQSRRTGPTGSGHHRPHLQAEPGGKEA
jgi:hypothetical protein